MITAITVTIGGRDLYLSRTINSIVDSIGQEKIQHLIVFNGSNQSPEINDLIDSKKDISNYSPEIINIPTLVSIGEALNITKNNINGSLVFKIDDDCLIHSKNFFTHARTIHNLIPRSSFSPFPVGLIGNWGGVPSSERSVKYSPETDTYYTFRKVNHIGGFARFCPSIYAKNITFIGTSHDEDGQFSSKYHSYGMYYLENALVVEHQESTLGQHERFGNNYFKGRF